MTGIACLPMYDLAGLEAETDQLWATIREALHAEGIEAPDGLTREITPQDAWTRPDLCLSQTCGLPLVTGRAGSATVLGAFDFGLQGCALGQYTSVIVVRQDFRPDDSLRFAFNERGSQSGYAAPKRFFGKRFHAAIETGSHLNSLEAVAQGRADIAALDAVTWRLAQTVSPHAQSVRVIDHTPPTPGLPLITAPDRDPVPYRRALTKAATQMSATPHALGLRGFVPFARADYDAAIHAVD